MTVLAGILAALAAGLLWPGCSAAPPPSGPAATPGGAARRWGLVALAAAGPVVVLLVDASVVLLAGVAAGALAAGWHLAERGRSRREAHRRQVRVVESCELLVGELSAGVPPPAALRHAAEAWPVLVPVATAAALGADVPAAFRRQATLAGAEALSELASAWVVAERSGAALARVLGQVAGTARAREATRRLVRAELASAQATARTVAVLPAGVLVLGAALGADPWHFLLHTVAGAGCLGVGAALSFLGLHWIDGLAAQASRR